MTMSPKGVRQGKEAINQALLFAQAADILRHPMGKRATDPYLAKAAIHGHTGRRAVGLGVPRGGTVPSLSQGVERIKRRRSRHQPTRSFADIRAAAERVARTWRLYRSQQVDQGQHPACVGATVEHWQKSLPVYTRKPYGFLDLYQRCKAIDGYPGDGTDVLSMLKVCRELGLITADEWWYQGSQDNEALDWWFLNKGGLWVGVNMTESMFRSGPDGAVVVEGEPRYGHEMFFAGTDRTKRRRWGVQSWGVNNYGDRGRFYWTDSQWDWLWNNAVLDCVGVEEVPR
jgi:hypothetical protein